MQLCRLAVAKCTPTSRFFPIDMSIIDSSMPRGHEFISACFLIFDSSNVALDKLSSLETILCLERGPAADGTRLDTHHLLVAVLGSIIADALSSLLPWIPDDGVLEVIPNDIEAGLAIDED